MSAMASQITSISIAYSTVWSKKAPKLRVTGLCEGNSPFAGEFPAQWASNSGRRFHFMTSSCHDNLPWTVSSATEEKEGTLDTNFLLLFYCFGVYCLHWGMGWITISQRLQKTTCLNKVLNLSEFILLNSLLQILTQIHFHLIQIKTSIRYNFCKHRQYM